MSALNWTRDITLACRRLARSPFFLATALGTLTVGLGAFAVVYTAVDKILIERLPYRSPDDLYFVWRDQSASSGLKRDWLAGPDIADLQSARGVIESAAGMQLATPTISASRDGEPLQVVMMLTSPNVFDLLGVSPMVGRAFRPEEVGPQRPAVAILSHGLWRRLGGESVAIGSQVWLSGTPYTVVGVMGPNFRFVRHAAVGTPQEPDLYVPFRFNLADQKPEATSFAAMIRVRPGTSSQRAEAAVNAVAAAVAQHYPQASSVTLYPVGLHEDLVAPVKGVLLALAFAGVFLLLVLTVNFSSLLLARAALREREFAVLRAMGANGPAVARAMLLEGALVGVAGGVTGALVGYWGSRLLVALAPLDLPRRGDIALDWRVGVVVSLVGLGLGVIAASAPAAWTLRSSLASLLVTGTVRGVGASQRLRRGIVVAQVALTLVLLSAGGLVARSFQQLLASDPGFRPAGVLTFSLTMGPRLYPKTADALIFQDRVTRALQALPGVSGVSATTALPLTASASQATISIPGASGNTGDRQRDAVTVDVIGTRAGYTDVMGMRVIAGRGFAEARRETVQEALIDQHLARQFFPTGTPIGVTVLLDGHPLTIVGVVNQARLYTLHQDGRPQLFVRAEDSTPYVSSFVVKTSQDPHALEADVHRIVRDADPRIAISAMQPMNDIVTDALRQQRLSVVLIGGFALGSLVLVTMGVFGVMSGAVLRRRGELAVRMALGGTHQALLRSVVGEGIVLVGLGMVLGIPGVYIVGRVIRGLLIGITPWDPLTLAIVALALLCVTVAACYLPARRVLRINPASLLQGD